MTALKPLLACNYTRALIKLWDLTISFESNFLPIQVLGAYMYGGFKAA